MANPRYSLLVIVSADWREKDDKSDVMRRVGGTPDSRVQYSSIKKVASFLDTGVPHHSSHILLYSEYSTPNS